MLCTAIGSMRQRQINGFHQHPSWIGWVTQFFNFYIFATGLVYDDEGKTADLEDMRLAVLSTTLNSSRSKACLLWNKLKCEDEPVHELYRELMRTLAWEYNWLYVNHWRVAVQDGLGQWPDSRAALARLGQRLRDNLDPIFDLPPMCDPTRLPNKRVLSLYDGCVSIGLLDVNHT
jgi:hypothetical protein